jgi:protein-S-isoprenylcysteine O-methyltransferase Ste14
VKKTNVELRIPPVIVVAVSVFAMWLLARFIAFAQLDFPGRLAFSFIALFAGLLTVTTGLSGFFSARTTVDPMHPETASSLVTSGVYKWSRNPMYLGFALILIAWSLYLANAAAFVVAVAFVVYMTRFQIIPEERILEAKFGPAFLNYRAKTRRWL